MSTQPNQQKRPQCKKCKKLSNIEEFFLACIAYSAFYKIHGSGAAYRHAPVQYAKYVVFFFFFVVFFLSSHHDTNPLLHLFYFVKKYNYNWLILTVNHQGSYIPLFCLHPVGQTLLYPSKFCDHLKHSAK